MGSNNTDILILSKTYIIENVDLDAKNEPYKIQGYSFINGVQSKREGGGVGIFIKEGVDCKRRKDLELENIEIMWIEFFIKSSKNIFIAALYCPLDTSSYLPRNFLDSLNETIGYAEKNQKRYISETLMLTI